VSTKHHPLLSVNHKKLANPTTQLGSHAIMMALAFSCSSVQADEALCNEQTNQEQRCIAEKNNIERIKIHGVRDSLYNVKQSGDLRHLAPLADTPQTITVLTQDQIQESGRTDLKEILATQSGVTLGTGENGNAFGDRYIIRGHEARSDVFVDGLRDPGMTTRESFATAQVEITKGPSATFAGRGSSGGAVNSITKTASPSYDFGRVDVSVGSDDYHRVTVDANKTLNQQFALRVNALDARENSPGRDGIIRDRSGALLSANYLPTDHLSFNLDAYYLQSDDVPDLGSYFDRTKREPVKNIPVYAQNEDFLNSEVFALTLRTDYQIADNLRFYNATRFGKTENAYLTTGLSGSTRAASDSVAPGENTNVLSTHQGWQEVDYVASQFNLYWDKQWLALKHKFVFGFEYSDESVDNGVYEVNFNQAPNCQVDGRRGLSDAYCIVGANQTVLPGIRHLMDRSVSKGASDALFDIETSAFYVMDTVKINAAWDVFFGLRQDSFDYSNDTTSRSGEQLFSYSDTLYNGHLGLVFNLSEDANFYATYSTATNINGGESDLGANCGYGGLCGDPEQAQRSDPEFVENLEIGSKWQFMDDELLATVALFRITKSDVMESVGDAYSSLGTLNTGKNRVQGIELGLSGEITEQLSIQASAAVMNSQVLESFITDNIGRDLSNFADQSYYLQLRYQATETFAFGGDYTYKSEMYGGQPDTAAGFDSSINDYTIVVPAYSVVNLFANYSVNDALTLRLNVGNVFDKEYWTAAYRSGSFMYLGDGRSLRASMTYEF